MPPSLHVLESQLQTWAVPNDVREAIHRAVTTVAGEGVGLVEALVGDQVAIAVRGQPEAIFVSQSRVSMALTPPDADRAYRSDSVFGLEKQSEETWVVHCRYGRLDQSRLNAATSLMVRALRRYAPRPAAPAATRTRQRSAKESGGSRANASTQATRPRRTSRQAEEDRQRAAEAAIPRCPVPGCNLPMVGGSCGFHD